MIAKVEGLLEAIVGDRAMVKMPGGFTFEVLLPAYTAARLQMSTGSHITFHTLTFLESQNQGASFIPRLAGFTSEEDRAFYNLFTTTKGIGPRRALRAMALATAQIAAAIEDRDLATLQSLPEVGKRTAETIVATLKGKVDEYISVRGAAFEPTGNGAAATTGTGLAREALTVLTQLGERRQDAAAWIDQVLSRDDAPDNVQDVVAEVYRLKGA